jgi:hypothetical protein
MKKSDVFFAGKKEKRISHSVSHELQSRYGSTIIPIQASVSLW